MPRVTLVGYRGSGKSTVAPRLAEMLGCSWVDADLVLEQELGTTIAEVVAERGELFFRDREADLLERMLAERHGVLATGGGVVLRPANRKLLANRGRPVVWLEAPAEVLRTRLAADPATALRRPALAGGDVLDEVAAAIEVREPLYREVADARIDVSRTSAERIAERIAAWLAAWQPASAPAGAEPIS
jgi:shikimate kinase